MPWCPHSFQGINTHTQTGCMVTPLTHSAQQAPDWPPALASGLLSLHFMTLPLLLASLCLMKTICKFLQIYAPILSEFIRRLYSVICFSLLEDGLIIPLIHERDLISSPRMSLQTATHPVSCRAQTSGSFSGRFRVELPSSPHSCCVPEPSHCSELWLCICWVAYAWGRCAN